MQRSKTVLSGGAAQKVFLMAVQKNTLFGLGLFLTLMMALALAPRADASARVCVAFAVQLRNDTGTPQTAEIFFGDPNTGEALTRTVRLTLQPGETGTLRLVAPARRPFFLGGGPGGLTIVSSSEFGDVIKDSSCFGGRIDDGRLNGSAKHLAAPVAVYCTAETIDVYTIDPDTGDGFLVIREARSSGQPESGQNTLLAQGGGVSLWWLGDGQYQINATTFDGKDYVIAWRNCDAESLVALAP